MTKRGGMVVVAVVVKQRIVMIHSSTMSFEMSTLDSR